MVVVPLSQPKPKKCRVCRESFQPRNSLQVACGLKCALEHQKRERIEVRKAADKARKQKLKTRSDWQREAQRAFNAYVRARDIGRNCVSCGAVQGATAYGGKFDCGHYRSTGAAPHLRFHTLNAAAQCVRCNRDLSGNTVEMRKGMVARLGEDRVQALEHDQRERKYSVEDLRRIKSLFSKRARWYRARRGQ